TEMLTSNANRREDILEKTATLEQELQEILSRLAEEKTSFTSLEEQLSETDEQLQKEAEMLSVKSNFYNQENIQYHQHLNKVDRLVQEVSFKQSAFEGSIERIQKSQEELSSTDQEIKNLLESHEIKDEELIELYVEKETVEAAVNEAEKSYYAGRGEIDELEKSIREVHKTREHMDTLTMELQEKLNEVRLKLNGIKERLSVEFE